MATSRSAWERLTDHSPYLLILLLLVAFNWTLHKEFFVPTFTSDAIEYLETAERYLGEDVPAHPNRLLKPLPPLGIAGLSYLTGDIVSAFQLEVGLMYIVLALVSYAFFFSFFRRKRVALAGSALLISSYPALFYGLDLYTETGAWALYIAALLGVWNYLLEPRRRWFWFSVVVIILGMLWKEYSVIAGVFFGLVILFHPSLFMRGKFRDIILYTFVAAGLLILWQAYVYLVYHFSYLDWYRIGIEGDNETREYTLYHIGKSLFATMLLVWALVPLGIWKWKTLSFLQKRFILLLVLPSMMFLLWGYVSSRIYYVVAPLLILLSVHGLHAFARWNSLLFFGVVALVASGGYAWLFMNSLFRAML